MDNIKIIAHGKYLPKRNVKNQKLEEKLNLEEGYIYKRTGIKNRVYITEETLEKMAIEASIEAIKNGKIDKEKIDMIIVSTTSTDRIMPGISYLVQKELDIKNCMCLDILAGCNGYVNAFDIARNYIAIGKVDCALVIGVDILSEIIDNTDISTSIILSDGAGATIIEKSEEEKTYYSNIKSIGQRGEILEYTANEKIKMDGSKVYRYAITETVKIIQELLENANESIENIKYIVPHQSNMKIMSQIAKRLNVDINKFYINIENIGNTFCASIPIALEEMEKKKVLHKNDKVILLGYGGGLNTGCILIEM